MQPNKALRRDMTIMSIVGMVSIIAGLVFGISSFVTLSLADLIRCVFLTAFGIATPHLLTLKWHPTQIENEIDLMAKNVREKHQNKN